MIYAARRDYVKWQNTRKNAYEKTQILWQGFVITLFLHLSLLSSDGDQILNPGRSTTIQTNSTDEEEKIFSL